MIIQYENGNAFIDENRGFLEENKSLSSFFFIDAPLVKESNKSNYALKAYECKNILLALKAEPYQLMLYGRIERAEELADYLVKSGYEFDSILGEESLCESFSEIMMKKYGAEYSETLAMDFMKADKTVPDFENEVGIPDLSDLDEIVFCLENFVIDCGLSDKVVKETVAGKLSNYRILRKDGKIASMASFYRSTDNEMKIASVYTRPEYRKKGYAKIVVSRIMNEIIGSGYIPTLNVDKKNPISNRLYYSLGFEKVFSQGEFRMIRNK